MQKYSASVLFTLLSSHDRFSTEDIIKETINIIQLLKKEYKDTTYNIVRLGAGLHCNATRLHTHIAFIIEYTAKKPILHWDKQTNISHIRKMINKDYDFKVTQYLDTDPLFSDETGISYCLKEYEKNEDIIMREHFIGLDDELLEQLRQYGNKEYKRTCAENERTEKRKQQSESESELIENFILTNIQNYDYKVNKHLVDDPRWFKFLQIKEQYKLIKIWILDYFRCKAEKSCKPIIKTFKAINIRDYAINYLAGYEFTNLEELADFLN